MLLHLSYICTLSKTIREVWNRILILKSYPYFSLEKLVSISAPCLTWCLLRLIIDIILWYLCFCISKFSRWLHSTFGLEVFGYSFTMGFMSFSYCCRQEVESIRVNWFKIMNWQKNACKQTTMVLKERLRHSSLSSNCPIHQGLLTFHPPWVT